MTIQFREPYSVKSAENEWRRLGPATQALITELNAPPFLQALQALTGIANLLPDPWLDGGGLHQISRGGRLKVHADFNKHQRFDLDRRLNLIVYLNDGWDPAWRGQLELWDQDMAACIDRVDPVLGRAVVFSTTTTSYHGHPDPLECPADTTRKSLALYYYTNGRPDDEVQASHSTLFQTRPGDQRDRRDELARKLRRFVPPIAFDAVHAAKRQAQRVRAARSARG
jgi:hypothetical protein